MQNRVLIFDFDGTIADTFQLIVAISNHLADEFEFKKMTPEEAERMKHNTLNETIRQLNVPLLKIPMIVARAKDEVLKEITRIKPIEGLKEILMNLKTAGVTLGILSSNSFQNVSAFLRTHDLDVFDFVTTSSKIWSKNHNLDKLISREGFRMEDVVYVGDETRDIVAARKLGIRVAAVTWGYNSSEALEAHHPDYLLSEPSELMDLITPLPQPFV